MDKILNESVRTRVNQKKNYFDYFYDVYARNPLLIDKILEKLRDLKKYQL